MHTIVSNYYCFIRFVTINLLNFYDECVKINVDKKFIGYGSVKIFFYIANVITSKFAIAL